MARLVLVIHLILLTFSASSPARAIAVLDLRSGDCHEQTECTLALSGNVPATTVAHLSAPRVSFGADNFFAYSNGMIFGTGVFPHAFDLTFNQSIQWIGGTLELQHSFSGLNITGPSLDIAGVLASNESGAFTFASPLVFQANEAYRFQTAPSQSFSFGVLGQLELSSLAEASDPSVVPIPATLPLMLGVLATLAALRQLHVRNTRSNSRHRSADHAVA